MRRLTNAREEERQSGQLQSRRKGGDGQRREPRHRRGDRARVRRAGRDRDRLVAQAGGARPRRGVDPRRRRQSRTPSPATPARPTRSRRFFARVEAEFGRLDVHVNNAAINPYYGPVIDTPLAAFDKTLEVDLRGYFLMTQAAARLMAQQWRRLDHQHRLGLWHHSRASTRAPTPSARPVSSA